MTTTIMNKVTEDQITITLLAAGLTWRQSREQLKCAAQIYFNSDKQKTHQSFLDRAYVQSKCMNTHSPLANLVIDSVKEEYAKRGVSIS